MDIVIFIIEEINFFEGLRKNFIADLSADSNIKVSSLRSNLLVHKVTRIFLEKVGRKEKLDCRSEEAGMNNKVV